MFEGGNQSGYGFTHFEFTPFCHITSPINKKIIPWGVQPRSEIWIPSSLIKKPTGNRKRRQLFQ
jgi:hypothetical protein